MGITVEIKNVYGAPNIYPVCAQAKFFAALAGTKTLTAQAIKLIKQQGYTVAVLAPEVI